MNTEYIAIDLGATSGRVILASLEDKHLRMEALHRFRTPLIEDNGKWYWDIDVIIGEISSGLLKAKGHNIKSIGIDTWGVDFCKMTADGKLHRPRAYRDPYTEGVPEQFFKKMPKRELYERTGIQIMNFNSVFQLYAQNMAGDLADAEKILFLPDAISYVLTGRQVCEYTILSTSALMNPRNRRIDSEILQACGLSESLFPEIVMPGTTVGTLKDEFGLGPVPVVAVAGHDTASAVVAVPALGGDFAYISSGTWSLMGIETDAPVINDTMFSMNYTNEGGASGNIRLLKNITGMWLLEQCIAKWKSEGKDYAYSELHQMALSSPASKELIDPDSPEFAAPTDMPAALSAKVGHPLSVAQTVRLIYDSLAAKYAEVFHNLETICGHKLSVLHIIGGGCLNDVLSRMTANACRVKVVTGPSEGTVLGNVMIQTGLSRQEILDSIEIKTYIPDE